MSLMNDALRKKKSEEKHPSGTDFLQDDTDQSPQNKYRLYATIAVLLVVCIIGGYFFYEYLSLSNSMTPISNQSFVNQAPDSQSPEPSVENQDKPVPENIPTETTAPSPAPDMVSDSNETDSKPVVSEKQSKDSKTVLKPSVPKKTPTPSATGTLMASRPVEKSPEPTIEPEGAAPQIETEQKAHVQPQEEAQAIALETDANEERFYRKGVSYHRQNNLDMAIRMYQTVLRKNPVHRATRFNLASAYIQLGAFEEAGEILHDLNLSDPQNSEILLNMAVVEIGLDNPQKALTLLESAQEASSDPSFAILLHQGIAYSRMGEFEKALIMYQKAEKLAPKNPGLLINTAIAYDHLTYYDQAIIYYQMFLENSPSTSTTDQGNIESRLRLLNAYLSQEAINKSQNETQETEKVE